PDVARLPALATFLAEKGMVGEGAFQLAYDFVLGLGIDFAGVVLPGLLHHIQRFQTAHLAQDQVAGLTRGLDHEGDGGLLHAETTPRRYAKPGIVPRFARKRPRQGRVTFSESSTG